MSGAQGQLILSVVVLVIGLLLGAAVAWWIAGSRKPAKVDPFAQFRGKYLEQAHLWRERGSGKLGVRVGNEIIASPRQLNDVQLKALQVMTRDWCAWMEMAVPAPLPAESPRPQAQPQPGVLITPPPAVPATTLPVEPPPFAAAQPATPPVTRTSAPPAAARQTGSLPPLTLLPGQSTSIPVKPKSIVEQIDEILQEKLALSAVRNKGVRLVEDAHKGVVVWVGLDHFDGVDQVTDPEVKALLRAAAAEWEARNQPGQK
jgi:hypothetical protein